MIPIFKAEKDLAEKIQANASIAYLCPIQKFELEPVLKASIDEATLSIAGKEDPDLYHTLSILVTTSWNKNDDVFLPEEVWASRHTPEHKQTNIEHNDDKIVGHIVGNWPVNNDYKLLKDDLVLDDLPETFHILTAGVIYRQRSNPETLAEVQELINQIEAGKKFVSMECMFKGFDYAVQSSQGDNQVVARASDTAFLTKHLRAYGGTGEYEGHRIGRLLRRITFCGKGYVDKPANSSSIIFDRNHLSEFTNITKNNAFLKNGVISSRTKVVSQERLNMSDNTHYENKISDLEKQVGDLKDQLSKADVQKLQDEINELKEAKDAQASKISELEQEKKDLEKTKSDLVEAKEAVEKQLTDTKASHDETKTKFDELMKEKLKADRVAKLVNDGVDKELAEKKVELYANLNDEQFEAVAEDILKAVTAVVASEAEANDDEDDNKDDEVVASAKPNSEPDMTDSVDDNKLETTRAGLAKWVSSELNMSNEEA